MRRFQLVLAALLVAAAAFGSIRLERVGLREVRDEELPFFPSGRLLDLLCLGHRTLAADLTWLSAIQYYGKHHMGDRQYPLARHLFEVTTRIDPQFRGSYIFGALVLADEAGDLEGARQFLTNGVRSNPGDWTLAFQRGFIEYMRGDRSTGALWMARASRMPDAASYAPRLAAFACSRVGRDELAARLWEEMAAGEDPALRALALERLRDLRARQGRQ